MSALQNNARQPSTTSGEHSPSTIVLVAVANVAQPEEGVGIVKRFSGQDLIDLFHEMDRPDSDKAIVGVQLAISPELNGTSRWIAEAVIDFARVKLFSADAPGVDTYAYRLASNAVFRDSAKVEPSDILEWRSLYEVSSADGGDDPELVAHQTWLSTVITRMVNAVNLSEKAVESQ
ncbi:hypothetical protein ACIPIN_00490 [Pseudomonas sp. NPDC087697]|uniref:hypothetical protein n=1 Tax=Pseudomonas sp. NPDC087697 TaxID=3364447 RepID=UPI003816B592